MNWLVWYSVEARAGSMEGCSIAVGIPPVPFQCTLEVWPALCRTHFRNKYKQEVLTKQSSQAALPCGGHQREQRFKSACTSLFINYFFFFFFFFTPAYWRRTGSDDTAELCLLKKNCICRPTHMTQFTDDRKNYLKRIKVCSRRVTCDDWIGVLYSISPNRTPPRVNAVKHLDRFHPSSHFVKWARPPSLEAPRN